MLQRLRTLWRSQSPGLYRDADRARTGGVMLAGLAIILVLSLIVQDVRG